MQSITIKPYISSIEGIQRGTTDTVTGSVLSQAGSSHDPVFVFDDSDTFVGLVSPYETIFASNYPPTTKLSSLAVMPPTITAETPVHEVAQFMLAAKVYTLPVTGAGQAMVGVVRAADIMKEMTANPSLLGLVSEHITPHDPVTAPIDTIVQDVFHALKERKVSRMLLVSDTGALAGIVTRGDLLPSMLQSIDRERVANEGTRAGRRSASGEKEYRLEEPVTKYASTLVDTKPVDTPVPELVVHLIESEYNNVVLVDGDNKPAGFLSTRDVLVALSKLQPESSINIILKKPSDTVSDEELEQATLYLEQWSDKFSDRLPIQKIELNSQEPKNTAGVTKKFNITLMVTPDGGSPLVAEVKDRDYLDGIREATDRIEKQQRRSVR